MKLELKVNGAKKMVSRDIPFNPKLMLLKASGAKAPNLTKNRRE